MTLTLEEKTAIEKYPIYYTSPPDEAFEEMREKAIDEWNRHLDYPEAAFRAEMLPHALNIGDNFMGIFLRFEGKYQKEIVAKLSEETKEELRKRLVDADYEKDFIENIGL